MVVKSTNLTRHPEELATRDLHVDISVFNSGDPSSSHAAFRMTWVAALVEAYALEDALDIQCAYLSSGQLRKAALLRLAFTTAKLWLLDEPFVALDSSSVQVLKKQIEAHLERGGMIVMTSHQSFTEKTVHWLEYCL